jgi:hypothetical protein
LRQTNPIWPRRPGTGPGGRQPLPGSHRAKQSQFAATAPDGHRPGEPPAGLSLRRIAPNKPNLRQTGREDHPPPSRGQARPEAWTLPPARSERAKQSQSGTSLKFGGCRGRPGSGPHRLCLAGGSPSQTRYIAFGVPTPCLSIRRAATGGRPYTLHTRPKAVRAKRSHWGKAKRAFQLLYWCQAIALTKGPFRCTWKIDFWSGG